MRISQPPPSGYSKQGKGVEIINEYEIRLQFEQLNKKIQPYRVKPLKSFKTISLKRVLLQKLSLYDILEGCSGALKNFAIADNNLNEIELHALMRSLCQCSHMEHVSIQSNFIQSTKIKFMFDDRNAEFWSRLKILNLKDNLIQDKDLKFVDGLEQIETLILDKNKLECPYYLIMKRWHNLKELSLSDNQIQTEPALKIIWNLVNERRPIVLMLQNNGLDEKIISNEIALHERDADWKLKCTYSITKMSQMQKSMLRAQKQIEKPVKAIEEGVKCIKFGSEIKKMIQEAIPKYEQTYNSLDEIHNLYPELTPYFCTTLLNEPPTKEQQKKSDKIQAQLKSKIQKPQEQKDPNSLILLVLKEFIEQKKGNSVIFHQKSNIKTQMTTKILCSYLPNNVAMYEHKQQDDKQWNFDMLYNDPYKLEQYKKKFKQNLSKENNIPPQAIRIHKISKGSMITLFQVDKKYEDLLRENKKMVQTHQYFRYFHLSPEDFCHKGNMKYSYRNKDGRLDWRGGWPYFLPVNCQRFGLNVSRKYDNGSDRWLQMAGKDGQWVVAFHGVSNPGSNFQNKAGENIKVMNSIMGGLQSSNGEMLIKAKTNAYKNSFAVNMENTKIGEGVYCSPHIQTCLTEYTGNGVQIKNEKYFLVLQCRVNPESIKVCGRNDYWVINQPKDIRPYGIILIKGQKQKREYPTVDQLYGERKFTWEYYKNKIKEKQDQLSTQASLYLKRKGRIGSTYY